MQQSTETQAQRRRALCDRRLGLQSGIDAHLREEHLRTEFRRAMTDEADYLPLNDFMVYYHTELAAVMPIGRGVYNPKGRKLDILQGGAWPTPAMRIGATP